MGHFSMITVVIKWYTFILSNITMFVNRKVTHLITEKCTTLVF